MAPGLRFGGDELHRRVQSRELGPQDLGKVDHLRAAVEARRVRSREVRLVLRRDGVERDAGLRLQPRREAGEHRRPGGVVVTGAHALAGRRTQVSAVVLAPVVLVGGRRRPRRRPDGGPVRGGQLHVGQRCGPQGKSVDVDANPQHRQSNPIHGIEEQLSLRGRERPVRGESVGGPESVHRLIGDGGIDDDVGGRGRSAVRRGARLDDPSASPSSPTAEASVDALDVAEDASSSAGAPGAGVDEHPTQSVDATRIPPGAHDGTSRIKRVLGSGDVRVTARRRRRRKD